MDSREVLFLRMLSDIDNLMGKGYLDFEYFPSDPNTGVSFKIYEGSVPDKQDWEKDIKHSYSVEMFRGEPIKIHYRIEGVAHGTLCR